MEKESQKKNRIKNRFIPELLAPAGNKEAFIAAVEAGADAIYCGTKKHNARMSAGNFTLEEMKAAVDFAHLRGVKVYVTMNTLLSDDELTPALETAEALREMGVDTLIIQDLGLAWLLRKTMPDFPIHMSTQGSIYDAYGVKVCGELGFSRVVLARELSLMEIKEICETTNVPVEVFCHGALCYCYSGQCQLSRAMGGRSGNRGACAQPCRMKYEAFDEAGKSMGECYPLSPADMDVLDYIGELSEAGVASLKIEGRMKSPEYVATVVSIYRKYLDEYAERGTYAVSSEDRLALMQIFNRGFTDVELSGSQDENLMSGDSPKNKGVEIGRVVGLSPVTEKDKGRYYLDIETSLGVAMEMGDTLEIRKGDKGISFLVTYLEDRGKGLVRVGDINQRVEPGMPVYRMISSAQMKDASIYYKNKDWNQGSFIRKRNLSCHVTSDGEALIFSLKDISTGIAVSHKEKCSAEELDAAAFANRVETSFGKTGGTPFNIIETKCHGNFWPNIPMSGLNAIRRGLLEELAGELVFRREPIQQSSKALIKDWHGLDKDFLGGPKGRTLELYFYRLEDYAAYCVPEALESYCRDNDISLKFLVPAVELLDCDVMSLEHKPIPYVSHISRGKEKDLLISELGQVVDYCKANKVPLYLGNIGQLELIKSTCVDVLQEIDLVADFGINVFNKASHGCLMERGFKADVPSLEVDGVHFGNLPLMIFSHVNDTWELIDRKGIVYNLIKRDFSNQTLLVREEAQDVSGMSQIQSLKISGSGFSRIYVLN